MAKLTHGIKKLVYGIENLYLETHISLYNRIKDWCEENGEEITEEQAEEFGINQAEKVVDLSYIKTSYIIDEVHFIYSALIVCRSKYGGTFLYYDRYTHRNGEEPKREIGDFYELDLEHYGCFLTQLHRFQ